MYFINQNTIKIFFIIYKIRFFMQLYRNMQFNVYLNMPNMQK
jgi:hypothetical protein